MWYGAGQWMERREDAWCFESNLEAMMVCKTAQIPGVLVGLNSRGEEIYFLKTDALFDPRALQQGRFANMAGILNPPASSTPPPPPAPESKDTKPNVNGE